MVLYIVTLYQISKYMFYFKQILIVDNKAKSVDY